MGFRLGLLLRVRSEVGFTACLGLLVGVGSELRVYCYALMLGVGGDVKVLCIGMDGHPIQCEELLL